MTETLTLTPREFRVGDVLSRYRATVVAVGQRPSSTLVMVRVTTGNGGSEMTLAMPERETYKVEREAKT